jgi:RimJ/RimL family protein N-acetyltransferase
MLDYAGPSRRGQRKVNKPNGFAVRGAGRSGYSRRRYAKIRAESGSCACCHCLCALPAHCAALVKDLPRDTEQIGLGIIHVSDDAPQEIRGAPGIGRNGAGHATTRTRFGDSNRRRSSVLQAIIDLSGELLDTIHAFLSIPGTREVRSMPGSIRQAESNSSPADSFTFNPLARADFPTMLRWLNNPAVSKWWGEPPASIDELEGKHVPRLDGREQVFGFIAHYSDTPMGYLQWYRLSTEPDHPAVGLAPESSAAIDLFIGEDDYRHRGLGRVLIRAFLTEIVFAEPDVKHCAIDPCVDNTAAIAAYRKTGFREIGLAPNPHEHCISQIMLINRSALVSYGVAEAAAEAADADQHQE